MVTNTTDATEGRSPPGGGHRRLALVLGLWGGAVALAAQSGALAVLYPPLVAPLVALGIVVPVLVYALHPGARRYLTTLGLRPLTLFHIWRIPAALLFFWYGARGQLPPTFVRHAAYGDLLAGTLALALAFLPSSRRLYTAFHALGFADFVLAVGTGLTFTLLHDPWMSAIRELPLALIPLFGVGISGASHLIAFDLLRRGQGAPDPAPGAAPPGLPA